jgi:hypothetical protein
MIPVGATYGKLLMLIKPQALQVLDCLPVLVAKRLTLVYYGHSAVLSSVRAPVDGLMCVHDGAAQACQS